MKELRIIRSGHIWEVAHLQDGQPDPAITELFDGHHVLPTPFTTSVPLKVVMEEVAARNPGVLVTAHSGDVERVRFHIREYYRHSGKNPRIAGWHIGELLNPTQPCPACGRYWFGGCGH